MNRFFISRFLIVLSLFISSTSWAARELSCRNLFLTPLVLDPKDHGVHAPIVTDWTKATDNKTVAMAPSSLPGKHGGRLRVLFSPNGQWLSQHSTFRFDVQGDPRWFIGAVGKDVARFFGFEIIDPQTLIVPDPQEFQAALDKVNRALRAMGKEPIRLGVHASDDNENAPLQSYLDHFIKGQLSFASDGHHLVHDLSFHTGFIFTPSRLMDIAIKRTAFVRDYANFVFRHSTLFDREQRRRTLSYVKMFLIMGIDNGTALGNLMQIARTTNDSAVLARITSLLAEKQNLTVTRDEFAGSVAAYSTIGLLGGTVYVHNAPITFSLLPEADYRFPLEDYAFHILYEIMTQPLQLESTKTATRNELLKALRDFKKTPQGENASFDLAQAILPPTLEKSAIYDHERVLQELTKESDQRFQEILDAVHSLRAKDSP